MENQNAPKHRDWTWKLLVAFTCISPPAVGLICYLWLFESFSYPLRLAMTLMAMALMAVHDIFVLRQIRAKLDAAALEREDRLT